MFWYAWYPFKMLKQLYVRYKTMSIPSPPLTVSSRKVKHLPPLWSCFPFRSHLFTYVTTVMYVITVPWGIQEAFCPSFLGFRMLLSLGEISIVSFED